MRYFSAAPLSRALDSLKNLFASPCGRHSAFGRRRRSTRVRRYAPLPEHSSQAGRVPEHSRLPAPPPSSLHEYARVPDVHDEDVALVRPYYTAHERLLSAEEDRVPRPRDPVSRPLRPENPPGSEEVRRAFAQVQERAAAILRQWATDPEGDLLSGPAPRFGVVRPTEPTASSPSREWEDLAELTRLWLGQKQREEALV